jgi:polar amino acid transport system substrate-binding protein
VSRGTGIRGTALAVALALLAAVPACANDRARVATPASTTPTTAPAAPAVTSTCTAPPEASVASFEPGPTTADAAKAQTIKKNVLVAGVSADTYLMGFRDPATADLVGFDVDILHEIARALFGDPGRIEFKVINNAQRLPALEKGEVDIVARSMTITCARWERINFSSEYLRAGQRLLVRSDDAAAGLTTLDQQAGRRVCATTGSTGFDNLTENHPDVGVVALSDDTDCMVAFQQGTVDALISDDTILAGFARQDPYAKVVGPRMTVEPYGLGVAKGNVELTRFVNRVLEDVRARTWAASYDTWLGQALGPASPPRPDYGRQP